MIKKRVLVISVMPLFIILLAMAGVSFSKSAVGIIQNTNEGIKKVSSRTAIEKKAKEAAEAGDLDKALELYKEAIAPIYIDREYQKGTAMGGMAEIYKWRGEYEKALETMDWFLRDNPNPEAALLEKHEIEVLMDYRNTGLPRQVYAHIDLVKERNKKWLPPNGYGVGAGIVISDILRLYDTIGDHDAGIAFIDEILNWTFKTNRPEFPHLQNVKAAADAEKCMNMKTPDGYMRPDSRACKWLREYLLIREAFEKDKAEGTKGRATKALIQSDYFPW